MAKPRYCSIHRVIGTDHLEETHAIKRLEFPNLDLTLARVLDNDLGVGACDDFLAGCIGITPP